MIYTGLSRTGEIVNVKVHGGGNISEVYGGIGETSPIYYKSRTLTGTPPLNFKALGKPLSDYLIEGNTVQNGTPTPEAPVDVVGCGERTGNIADLILGKVPRVADGSLVTFPGLTCEYVPITSMSDTFSLTFDKPGSVKRFYVYFYSGDTLLSTKDLNYGTTITTYGVPSTIDRMRIRIDYGETTVSNVMLAKGKNPLPYEPYGYKIPITVNGTEYPIYLGTVPTTRRVKKLVLTGEENWQKSSSTSAYYCSDAKFGATYLHRQILVTVCTHYKSVINAANTSGLSDGEMCLFASTPDTSLGAQEVYVKDNNIVDAAAFKTFLATQYANGNPVTVWYVLATPETGIVNEPIHKIGRYADTITMAQASETIPTTAGSNTLSVGTTVQPSSMSITGNIKSN